MLQSAYPFMQRVSEIWELSQGKGMMRRAVTHNKLYWVAFGQTCMRISQHEAFQGIMTRGHHPKRVEGKGSPGRGGVGE